MNIRHSKKQSEIVSNEIKPILYMHASSITVIVSDKAGTEQKHTHVGHESFAFFLSTPGLALS